MGKEEVKPSKQFTDLKTVAETLEQGQDKEDILALFQRADKLYDIVKSFKGVKNDLASWSRKRGLELKDLQRWRQKWLPLLETMLIEEKKEREQGRRVE